jgi:hypothetical protein
MLLPPLHPPVQPEDLLLLSQQVVLPALLAIHPPFAATRLMTL